MKAKSRTEKYEMIKNMKLKIPVEELVKMKVDPAQGGAVNAARIANQYISQQGQKEAGDLFVSERDSHSNKSPNNKRSASALPNESDVPLEFIKFMKYCRDLKFEEKPDYSFLRRMFKDLFTQLGYEYDYVYDWTPILKRQTLPK